MDRSFTTKQSPGLRISSNVQQRVLTGFPQLATSVESTTSQLEVALPTVTVCWARTRLHQLEVTILNCVTLMMALRNLSLTQPIVHGILTVKTDMTNRSVLMAMEIKNVSGCLAVQ